jgi:hypothetical protein
MLIDFKELEKWPPFLVSALARKNGTGMTLAQIAAAAELPLRTACRISAMLSWNNVKLQNIEAFCRGCGFDMKHPDKQSHYLRNTAKAKRKFSHLSPVRRATFERRLTEWLKL